MTLTVWQLYKNFKQRLIEALGTVESAVNRAVTTTSQGNPFKLEKLT